MKKKTIPLLCACLAALMLLPTLASCSKRLVMDGAYMTDRKNKVRYRDVSGSYQAKAVSKEVYATFKLNGVKKSFYLIEGLDPLEWIASEYGELYYSGEELLPDLTGFEANEMMICTNSDVPMSLSEIKDTALISEIVARCAGAQENGLPDNADANYYGIRFSSAKYPHLYYCMKMAVCEDGVYLFNRYEGIYVNIGALLNDYVPAFYSDPEDS